MDIWPKTLEPMITQTPVTRITGLTPSGNVAKMPVLLHPKDTVTMRPIFSYLQYPGTSLVLSLP